MNTNCVCEPRRLEPYVDYAMQFIPAQEVEWLKQHCSFCIMALVRLDEPESWGLCEAIDPDNAYWLTFDTSLFNADLKVIVTTIIHECAHAVSRHNGDGIKEQDEKEADALMQKWVNEWERKQVKL